MSKKIKLLIEVDEENYQLIKGMADVAGMSFCEILRNGTPYNPTDDLISRSELQERREADNDLIKAFELLKAHCKNRECNKDCIFFRELAIGENKDQYCALCEIVTSDDKENEE